MRTMLTTTVVILCVMTVAAPVAAQPAPAPEPGRVELGVNGAGFALIGAGVVSAGPQVTLRFSRRHALQLGVDARHDRFDSGWNVGGLYTALYRYTFTERGVHRGFLLAGAAGGIGASHHEARTYTSPARTITNRVYTGPGEFISVTTEHPARTYTYPERSDFEMTVPMAAVLGAGVESQVARRLVLQGQVAVVGGAWGVGVRAAFGIHVPLGRMIR
jgi:hypothetical protein